MDRSIWCWSSNNAVLLLCLQCTGSIDYIDSYSMYIQHGICNKSRWAVRHEANAWLWRCIISLRTSAREWNTSSCMTFLMIWSCAAFWSALSAEPCAWPFECGSAAAESVSMSWGPLATSDVVSASLEFSQVAMEWKEVRSTVSVDTGTPAPAPPVTAAGVTQQDQAP